MAKRRKIEQLDCKCDNEINLVTNREARTLYCKCDGMDVNRLSITGNSNTVRNPNVDCPRAT